MADPTDPPARPHHLANRTVPQLAGRSVVGLVRPIAALIAAQAWWLLPAYLLVPRVLKTAVEGYVPVNTTLILAIAATIAGLSWFVTASRRRVILALPGIALWALLTGLILVGTLVATDPPAASRTAASWIVYTGLPLLAAFPIAASQRQLRRFVLTFFAVGLVVIGIGVALLPTVADRGLDFFGANRIAVARELLWPGLIVMPLLLWRGGTRRRGFALMLVGIAVLLAVSTGSRGPVIAFALTAAGLLIVTLIRSPRRRVAAKLALMTSVTVAIVLIGGLWIVPNGAVARFALLSQAPADVGVAVDAENESGGGGGGGGSEDDGGGAVVEPSDVPESSVALRVRLYLLAMKLVSDAPITGAGTGGFASAAAATPGLESLIYPHNLVLSFVADFGLLGLATVGVLVAAALKSLWRSRGPAKVAFASLFLFLLLNSMVSSGIYENRLLWGMWLAALASPRLGLYAAAFAERSRLVGGQSPA